MTLTLNPYFSQWSFAAQPEGYPDVITYHVARSEEQALADVLAGRAHGSWTYNPLPATVTSRPGYIQRYELMDVQMLYVNSTLPPFNDLRVRQALNYALDRPRVLNTMHGPGGVVGLLTCQLLPPSIPGYRPYCPDQTGPADKPYQGRDLVKGRELAAASGTLGVPITVHQSTRFPFLVNLGEEAASTLRELGYHVEVEQIPPEHRSNNPEDPAYGTFQIFSQRGWGDYASPANFYDNLVSCRSHNISHYCNRTIDVTAQAAQALRATDPGGSLKAWTEVDHMLTDDAALVPIENRVGVAVVSPTVGNVLNRVAYGRRCRRCG